MAINMPINQKICPTDIQDTFVDIGIKDIKEEVFEDSTYFDKNEQDSETLFIKEEIKEEYIEVMTLGEKCESENIVANRWDEGINTSSEELAGNSDKSKVCQPHHPIAEVPCVSNVQNTRRERRNLEEMDASRHSVMMSSNSESNCDLQSRDNLCERLNISSAETVNGEASLGKKKRMLSMETKLEIIKKYEGGKRLSVIAKEYGRNPSTIGTILKQKEAIKAVTPSKGMTVLSNKRSHIHDDMERLLLIWIKDKEIAGDTITEKVICHKASAIFSDLIHTQAEDDAGEWTSQQAPPEFKASCGWFEKFKRRTGIHSVVRHGEAANSGTKEAEAFVKKFDEFTVQEGYSPQQVFNCDETGLFWKKMPRRAYITSEEKKLPGHKPMKDRLTLALCANANGDCKVKPLLVYHSESPQAFKSHKVLKEKLPVMWRANAKSLVTRQFFVEWMNLCFGPTVKNYLEEHRLSLRCLLVLHNAPAHPPGLEDDILPEYAFIKLLFLPPNTTPLLQPMDQQVISNFKKLYTKHVFKRCYEITVSTKLTLREFWKEHFDIVICLRLIDQAWQDVSKRILNSAWKKLWPDIVSAQDFKGIDIGLAEGDSENVENTEPVTQHEVEEIVSLGRSMELVVDEDDIKELLKEHQEELTIEDLKELEVLQLNVIQEQFSGSNEEEEDTTMTTAEIKEVLSAYHKVAEFIEKKHPEKVHTGHVVAQFNDICLSHFRNILKRRQKRASLDRYFSKRPLVNQGESQSDKKKQRRGSEEEIVEI